MATTHHDLVILGGGPGGYVAAIRAGQLGLRVACVEREALGGICLNWGCIPTKALLRSAEVLDLCRRAAEFGVTIEGAVSFDYPAILERAAKVVQVQRRGIESLFKKNQVAHVRGTGRLAGSGRIVVSGGNGKDVELEARHIIVATGARARSLPGVTIDGDRVIEYRGALSLKAPPRSLVVIGAGAIGVEFASFFRTLGVEVTLLEYEPRLVPLEDEEISAALAREFRRADIRALVGRRVTGARHEGDAVVVTAEDRDDPSRRDEVRADKVLVATGITGNVEGIGLEEAGVRVERGFIQVELPTYQTSARGIHAVGDVAGPPALAHVASAEGVACVERIAGQSPPAVDYDSVPACTFCHPEIASVGWTERRAREAGRAVKVGRFPFRALGKARAYGEIEGFAKVIFDEADGRLLGAHLVGPGASDLIAELALARDTEVNAASLIHTVHAHPTLPEAIKEASEDASGQAIHI